MELQKCYVCGKVITALQEMKIGRCLLCPENGNSQKNENNLSVQSALKKDNIESTPQFVAPKRKSVPVEKSEFKPGQVVFLLGAFVFSVYMIFTLANAIKYEMLLLFLLVATNIPLFIAIGNILSVNWFDVRSTLETVWLILPSSRLGRVAKQYHVSTQNIDPQELDSPSQRPGKGRTGIFFLICFVLIVTSFGFALYIAK